MSPLDAESLVDAFPTIRRIACRLPAMTRSDRFLTSFDRVFEAAALSSLSNAGPVRLQS